MPGGAQEPGQQWLGGRGRMTVKEGSSRTAPLSGAACRGSISESLSTQWLPHATSLLVGESALSVILKPTDPATLQGDPMFPCLRSEAENGCVCWGPHPFFAKVRIGSQAPVTPHLLQPPEIALWQPLLTLPPATASPWAPLLHCDARLVLLAGTSWLMRKDGLGQSRKAVVTCGRAFPPSHSSASARDTAVLACIIWGDVQSKPPALPGSWQTSIYAPCPSPQTASWLPSERRVGTGRGWKAVHGATSLPSSERTAGLFSWLNTGTAPIGSVTASPDHRGYWLKRSWIIFLRRKLKPQTEGRGGGPGDLHCTALVRAIDCTAHLQPRDMQRSSGLSGYSPHGLQHSGPAFTKHVSVFPWVPGSVLGHKCKAVWPLAPSPAERPASTLSIQERISDSPPSRAVLSCRAARASCFIDCRTAALLRG